MFFTRFAFILTALSLASALPIRQTPNLSHEPVISRRMTSATVSDVLGELSSNGTVSVNIDPSTDGTPDVVIGSNATDASPSGSEKIVLAHFMIGNAFVSL